MINKTFIYAILFLFLSGCSRRHTEDMFNGISDIHTYNIHYIIDDYSFYRPNCITVDSPYVYISDTQDCNISVFDWNLRHIGTIGNKGMGPGEFLAITDIASFNDSLVVFDIKNARVSFFDFTGNYHDSFVIPSGPTWGSITIQNNKIVTGSYNIKSRCLINVYSFNGEWVSGYAPITDMNKMNVYYRSAVINNDTTTYLAYNQEPRVDKYVNSYIVSSYQYKKAFIDMYPFFERFLENQERVRNQGSEMDLLCFWKGVIYKEYLIMPGPLYSLLILDVKNNNIMITNPNPIADELSKYGYHTYDDMALKSNELLMVSMRASAMITIALEDIIHATEYKTWYEPDNRGE